VKSEAKNVTDYLKEVPQERILALNKIRELCLTYLRNHEESMSYKMPSYKRNNQVEVAFASQKQHICIYFLIHDVMLTNQDLLKGLNHGKGCIRYSNPNKIDFDIIKKLLEETEKSKNSIC
jgi:uncharacterized protein YdhG (YjbR/CyaY superfamily)